MREKKQERETLRLYFASSINALVIDIRFAPNNTEFQLRILRIAINIIKDMKKNNLFEKFDISIWDAKGIRIYTSTTDKQDAILDDDFDNKLIDLNEQRKK